MPIALLTDFGTADSYVAVMKGVISTIAPQVPLIDLTHDIPAFDRVQAAVVLYQAYRYFPKGTIFVAVVDPGVGSERKAILVKTQDYYFVGPDNGLFTLVLAEQKIEKIIHLTNSKYFISPHPDPLPTGERGVGGTFQGRDIFAPVAAHLSQGVLIEDFGLPILDYQKLEDLFPEIKNKEIIGQVISIDRFGNAITNFAKDFLIQYFPSLQFSVKVGKKIWSEFKTHYAEGLKKKPFLIFGSSSFLEISLNQGSAVRLLKIKRGDTVSISLKSGVSSRGHGQ